MENQGKRKDQVKFSTVMAFVGLVGIVFCVGWLLITTPTIFKEETIYGPPHNYWVPVSKEDKDWTGTTQDEDTYTDEGYYCDTVYHMRYNSFADVPAGTTDTMIIVDGILYKMNDNRTQWMPIYPDEYIMWIGENGDTIWE